MVKEWGTRTAVLLDMGSGSFSNYQRFFNLDELDAVVLSHSHPDHWADIDSLAVAMRYTIGRSSSGLRPSARSTVKSVIERSYHK